jgi:glucose/arabinose dehydrogenase
MFASELGQNTLDELNLIEPGNNYGWPIKEAVVDAPDGTAPGATVDGFTYPWAWWPTSEASPSGIAVTDEAVYMAALRGQRLWRIPLTPEGVGTPHVVVDGIGRIRLASLGPDGALYLITSNGTTESNPTGDLLVRIVVREGG